MPKRRTLTAADVRSLALALPEAEESAHQGTPDFRVRGKIFATLPPAHPGRACLKATPIDVATLAESNPDAFSDAWGGRWLAVELSQVASDEFRALLEDAYRLVAPRSHLRR